MPKKISQTNFGPNFFAKIILTIFLANKIWTNFFFGQKTFWTIYFGGQKFMTPIFFCQKNFRLTFFYLNLVWPNFGEFFFAKIFFTGKKLTNFFSRIFFLHQHFFQPPTILKLNYLLNLNLILGPWIRDSGSGTWYLDSESGTWDLGPRLLLTNWPFWPMGCGPALSDLGPSFISILENYYKICFQFYSVWVNLILIN